MAFKIYRSGNYFIINDTSTGEDILRQVRDNIRWEKKDDKYSFFLKSDLLQKNEDQFVKGSRDLKQLPFSDLYGPIDFSDTVDLSGSAWASQEVLDVFLDKWTGYIHSETIGADASYNVINSELDILASGTIESGSSEDILIPDISFTDSNGTISSVPAGVDIVATPCGLSTYSSARLMKTGQTTSYATGDDGDLEIGRGSSFFTLISNNPFGNTNRFTDELGGQTYTKNIVIDWSTFDGTTVLGYKRTAILTANGSAGAGWLNAINGCSAISIPPYTSGWRLANLSEWNNIINIEYVNPLGYAPFSAFVWSASAHTSSSVKFAPNTYSWSVNSSGYNLIKDKNENSSCLAVRTFTVIGTTLI